MKKLFSLLTLLLLLCTSAWATDPTLDVEFTSSTKADFLKTYSTEGVTLSGDGNISSASGYYYGGCSGQTSTSDGVNKYYFGITAASGKKITKISLKISPNSSTVAKPIVIGWSESPTLTNVAYYEMLTGTAKANSKASAEWLTCDFSEEEEDITDIRIYRRINASVFSKDGGTTYIANEGVSVTLRIWEVKVWVENKNTITTETFTGVKVGGSALTENAGTNGYSLSGTPATTITLTTDLAVGSAPDNITLTNHREWSDSSEDDENVAVTFDGTKDGDNYFTGSATIGETDYTVRVKYLAACVTPTISTDPVSATYATGDAISALTVSASVSDGGSLSYQWYKDDEAIDGATNASYTPSAAGDYKCVVTNSLAGYSNASATSEEATITITAAAGTVTLNKNNVPEKNTDFSEGVITIDGNAFPDKGSDGNNTKVRTNNNIEIFVSDGYLITSVSIYGKTARDNQSIAMNSISVDNSTISHDAFSFTDSYSTLSTGTIYAKSNVTFTFDGAVVLSGDGTALNQIYATITIKWAKIDDEFDIVAGDYVTYSSTSVIDIPSGITAYTGEYNEATSMLSLHEIEGNSIPAEAGVILHNAGESTVHAIIPRSTAVDPEIPTNSLTGAPVAFSTFDRTNYTYYVLGEKLGVNGFYKYTGIGAIPAHKAYLRINNSTGEAGAPAVIRITDEENNATNLDNIDGADEAVKFIQNGKLFIKKNGVVYDILGHAVR